MKTIAIFLLCTITIFAQTKTRKCDPGYSLQSNGHCVGEFPAGDGCNWVTVDEEYGEIAETAIACVPSTELRGIQLYNPNYGAKQVDPKKEIPEAKITDGVTPDYETVPVTQKIPKCKAGFELKHFEPGDGGNIGGLFVSPEMYYSPPRWETSTPPNANVEWKDYRCFPKQKASVTGDAYQKVPCSAKKDANEGCENGDLYTSGNYEVVYHDGGIILPSAGNSDDYYTKPDTMIANSAAFDANGIGVVIDNKTPIPDGIACEKGSYYVLIKLVLPGVTAQSEGPTKIDGCYRNGATVTITVPK